MMDMLFRSLGILVALYTLTILITTFTSSRRGTKGGDDPSYWTITTTMKENPRRYL